MHYRKELIPTLAILSSLLVPGVLSLVVPHRSKIERRDLGAGSVENLEVREPIYAGKAIARAMGHRRLLFRDMNDLDLEARDVTGSVEDLEVREPGHHVGRAIRGVNPSVLESYRRTLVRMAQARKRLRSRDLGDLNDLDLEARDATGSIENLEVREPVHVGRAIGVKSKGPSVDRFVQARRILRSRDLDLEERELNDLEDDLVLRSLFDEIDDLEARSLFDDFDDLEAREILESLDELD